MAKNSTASPETGKTKKSLRDLLSIRVIAENSILAAIYVVLVLVVPFLSFGPVQCRFSEALVLLCFWRPDFTIGLSVGCLISNVVGAAIGSASPFDILISDNIIMLTHLIFLKAFNHLRYLASYI